MSSEANPIVGSLLIDEYVDMVVVCGSVVIVDIVLSKAVRYMHAS